MHYVFVDTAQVELLQTYASWRVKSRLSDLGKSTRSRLVDLGFMYPKFDRMKIWGEEFWLGLGRNEMRTSLRCIGIYMAHKQILIQLELRRIKEKFLIQLELPRVISEYISLTTCQT